MIVQGPGQQWINDDCNSTTLASCVSIPGNVTQVTVTVFAFLPQRFGTFDLVIDGIIRANDSQFGGSKLRLNLPLDGWYQMQTISTSNTSDSGD